MIVIIGDSVPADKSLLYFAYFSEKIGYDISGKLSAVELSSPIFLEIRQI